MNWKNKMFEILMFIILTVVLFVCLYFSYWRLQTISIAMGIPFWKAVLLFGGRN